MIELYSASTPNGFKISIALEEMAIPYKVITVDFESKAQLRPSFLAINPNGRIPAIIDRDNADLFHTTALLQNAFPTHLLLAVSGLGRLCDHLAVQRWLIMEMGKLF